MKITALDIPTPAEFVRTLRAAVMTACKTHGRRPDCLRLSWNAKRMLMDNRCLPNGAGYDTCVQFEPSYEVTFRGIAVKVMEREGLSYYPTFRLEYHMPPPPECLWTFTQVMDPNDWDYAP